MVKRIIISIALLFGILLLLLPKTDDESLAKIASASILMCTLDFRDQVAQQVIKEQSTSVEFKNKCPELIASLEMDQAGGIVITGKKYPLKMTLTPIVEGGKVRWSCSGEPAKSMSKMCTS